MDLLRDRADLRRLAPLRRGARPLVLVPTMGALHPGHLALVAWARRLGPTVVSIFVNPTQFGPGEDLAAYPRDLERDLALLAPLGVDAVFAPAAGDMFRPGERVMIEPGPAARGLCGDRRPGHFRGVLTVVAKLLNLVGPDVAVFGRKDAQQCLVIAEMVRDLDIPVRLRDLPTVRDADGLAMSSRNAYLSPAERTRALCLVRALGAARAALAAGERRTGSVLEAMRRELTVADAIDYAEIRRLPDLAVPAAADGHLLLAVAAHVGRTRLIDNLVLAVGADGVHEAALLPAGEDDAWLTDR